MNARILNWLLGGALVASLVLHLGCWTQAGGCVAAVGDAPPQIAFAALDLTDEQVDRLVQECGPTCTELDRIHAERAAVLARLTAAVASERIDPDEIAAIARRLGELRQQAVLADAQAVERVRAVLRPEQLQALSRCCDPVSDPR